MTEPHGDGGGSCPLDKSEDEPIREDGPSQPISLQFPGRECGGMGEGCIPPPVTAGRAGKEADGCPEPKIASTMELHVFANSPICVRYIYVYVYISKGNMRRENNFESAVGTPSMVPLCERTSRSG